MPVYMCLPGCLAGCWSIWLTLCLSVCLIWLAGCLPAYMLVCVSADRQYSLPTNCKTLRSRTQNGITQIFLVYCSLPQTKTQSIKKGRGRGSRRTKKKRRIAAFIRKKRMTRFLVSSQVTTIVNSYIDFRPNLQCPLTYQTFLM
jgi:hypothetical protein